MWVLIFAGLLAVSVGKETATNVAEKPETAKAEELVLLEIDVKEPAKRSPLSASGVYGASPNQYIIRHGDDAQELAPEYLALLQQTYTQQQPQQFAQNNPPQPRKPLSPFARQQQQLQTAYQNRRVPAIAPPRPRVQLHPQALAQAEYAAELQAQQDAHDRAEARARLRASATDSNYQTAAYPEQKLGTFEQELLQLVSANQAQEFKLAAAQPNRPAPQAYQPQYSQQQLVNYQQQQPQYVKPTVEPQLPEQYHIETSAPRYQQPEQLAAYQPQQPQQLAYHRTVPIQTDYVKPTKQYRPTPAPQYEYSGQGQAQNYGYSNEDVAQAQAAAQAAALAFQKITQASHTKHQSDALEQIRITEENFRQQTALEKIKEGEQVSEAGKVHIEEQYQPKDPEAAYRAQIKAQATAEAAAARRAQEAAEFKAHADAILVVQAQQQQHVKAQEQAHQNALNFERNQIHAQEQAQALANAQALALYKAHQAQRAKANSEIQTVARAQANARKTDPDHVPAVQYLLPNPETLPQQNSFFTNDQNQKYQASGSSYVPRSAPKPPPQETNQESPDTEYSQPIINQPRQAHKHKIPAQSYVSQSGLLKKAPVKSLTIEDIIDTTQSRTPQFVRIPSSKIQTLTQQDLASLINAGYTVTPVPETTKPTRRPYAVESTSAGYYLKKQRNQPVQRPEYIAFEEVISRPRPIRKNRPILRQEENDSEASEKVTFLVPVEPVYGTRQVSQSAQN
ncbi:mediator of RNA polymerase II transcription subunit 15-like [Leptopilina heterotoma]|uniref:mediator of RNA polymerase II transcription subunit 15-like n=1 Tax=Leptopilina heterotoma TaxID=63436 RepID=UPI001CA93602|nr:mediator of RNA polymerase II transcription subunit 15-like [Leptopilina heterotoma]